MKKWRVRSGARINGAIGPDTQKRLRTTSEGGGPKTQNECVNFGSLGE